MVLRRISPLSAGKLMAVLYALFGLLIGALMTLMSVMGGGSEAGEAMGMMGPMMGVGAIVILPIVWGILGFIGGLLGAVFFNIAAKIGGGLELDLS